MSRKLKILFYLLSNAFDDWKESIWDKDLDSYYCCDGAECCCGGATIDEMWSK